jgi:heme/copper-type cytochrome/quinol oxidase subunit 4
MKSQQIFKKLLICLGLLIATTAPAIGVILAAAYSESIGLVGLCLVGAGGYAFHLLTLYHMEGGNK